MATGDRVFTFVRRYRISTNMTDEQLVDAGKAWALTTGKPMDAIETPGHFFEMIADPLSDSGLVATDAEFEQTIEVQEHSYEWDERDPGNF